MSKIYLSPALHGYDNATKCPQQCSENTHCAQYIGLVESRLKALGFEVKRGGPATGTQAMIDRVAESNSWGADIHYVAHTNGGGGRYSLTLCWNSEDSKEKANILHKYRKSVNTHIVRTDSNLYEIRATKAVCLYDELIFHDNAEDCRWFHNGGMQQMAEETVQALCEMCGVPYKAETVSEEKKPTPTAKAYTLKKEPLYAASTSTRAAGTVTGKYYRWDNKTLRGRARITTRADYIGKAGKVTGWVDVKAVS